MDPELFITAHRSSLVRVISWTQWVHRYMGWCWFQSARLWNLHLSWNHNQTVQNDFSCDLDSNLTYSPRTCQWQYLSSSVRGHLSQIYRTWHLAFRPWTLQTRDSLKSLGNSKCFRPRVDHILFCFSPACTSLLDVHTNRPYRGRTKKMKSSGSPRCRSRFRYELFHKPRYGCRTFSFCRAAAAQCTSEQRREYQRLACWWIATFCLGLRKFQFLYLGSYSWAWPTICCWHNASTVIFPWEQLLSTIA